MPEFDNSSQRIWANEWCVGVGTLSDVDGETDVSITDAPLSTDMPIVFDGIIEACEGRVTVSDAYLVEAATVSISSHYARVRVWANHPKEPDRIIIGVTAALDKPSTDVAR